MTGTLAADQVGALLDARDAAPMRPLSHMTLKLDNERGGTEQIRLDLRGNTVGTHIALSDPADAHRMSLRVGELQRALEHRGLDADAVRVTTAPDLLRAASASQSADTGAGWTPRHGQHAQGQHAHGQETADRERSPANHRESGRQDADDPRQRARRASRGGNES
jgi:hypothetical protein